MAKEKAVELYFSVKHFLGMDKYVAPDEGVSDSKTRIQTPELYPIHSGDSGVHSISMDLFSLNEALIFPEGLGSFSSF
jgi:hypothetical protein